MIKQEVKKQQHFYGTIKEANDYILKGRNGNYSFLPILNKVIEEASVFPKAKKGLFLPFNILGVLHESNEQFKTSIFFSKLKKIGCFKEFDDDGQNYSIQEPNLNKLKAYRNNYLRKAGLDGKGDIVLDHKKLIIKKPNIIIDFKRGKIYEASQPKKVYDIEVGKNRATIIKSLKGNNRIRGKDLLEITHYSSLQALSNAIRILNRLFINKVSSKNLIIGTKKNGYILNREDYQIKFIF